MLNEGMIAVSGKPDTRLGFGESEPVTPENPKPIGSRQKDEDNNSIWD
jgi:hypothetical protein